MTTMLEQWLVTAPQMQPRSFTVERLPWGRHHLKRDGGAVTACGRFAVGWHTFWERPLDPRDPDACEACLRVALAAHTGAAAG